jgi:Mrp family chromosome partitioning ATPase
MNPTIIVQQNYDFSDLVLPANQQPAQPTAATSKAAVIRPVAPQNVHPSVHTHSPLSGHPNFQTPDNKKHSQTGETTSLPGQPKFDSHAPLPPRSIPVEIRPVSEHRPNTPPERSEIARESKYHTSVNTAALPDNQPLDLLASLSSNGPLPLAMPDVPPTQAPQASVIPTFEELTKGVGATPRVALSASGQPYRSATGADRAEQLLAESRREESAIEIDQRFKATVKARIDAESLSRISDSTNFENPNNSCSDRADINQFAQTSSHSRERIQAEAEKVTQEFLHGSDREIPSNVAAWDVEDFRWSETTNQIIVSGGPSLDYLHQSLLDLIHPEQSRIIVGGVGRGEGTTSIAISLARWIAASGKKVLLVDGDLSKAELSRQAGMAKNISWMNSIRHTLPNAELTVRSQKSNLCLLPLSTVESRSQWPRFIYDELGKIITQAQNDFDLIITDVGPVEQMMAELSRPSCIADATVLVHDGVQSGAFKTAQKRMKMFGLSNLIIAQNRAPLPTQNAA